MGKWRMVYHHLTASKWIDDKAIWSVAAKKLGVEVIGNCVMDG